MALGQLNELAGTVHLGLGGVAFLHGLEMGLDLFRRDLLVPDLLVGTWSLGVVFIISQFLSPQPLGRASV